MDTHAIEKTVPIERKYFTVSLGSNDRGEFLRITESTSHRYSNAIVIPMSGVADLMGAVAEVLREGNSRKGSDPKRTRTKP